MHAHHKRAYNAAISAEVLKAKPIETDKDRFERTRTTARS